MITLIITSIKYLNIVSSKLMLCYVYVCLLAAAAADTCMLLSSLSTTSIEDVAKVTTLYTYSRFHFCFIVDELIYYIVVNYFSEFSECFTLVSIICI
jgi:hypothetical protein